MKKRSIFVFLMTVLFIAIGNIKPIKAMQPTEPEEVRVTIVGINVKYIATTLTKADEVPNLYDYNQGFELEDGHPILEYEDDQGYKYLGHRVLSFDGESSERFSHTPEFFKIIIVTENNSVYVTKEIERFKIDEKYLLNLTDVIDESSNEIIVINDVSKDHNYIREIFMLVIRILLIIGIKLLIALLFLFKDKKELKTILIVSLITQSVLNILLNLNTRTSSGFGVVIYIFFIIFLAVIFGIVEATVFGVKFKEKFKAVVYGILANFISIILFLIFWSKII